MRATTRHLQSSWAHGGLGGSGWRGSNEVVPHWNKQRRAAADSQCKPRPVVPGSQVRGGLSHGGRGRFRDSLPLDETHPGYLKGRVTSLEKVVPPVRDELASLRERAEGVTPAGSGVKRPGGDREAEESSSPEVKEKKKKKKEKKEKKAKKKEKKKDKSESEKSSKEKLRPKTAAQKKPQALFSGTGMDGREKVRKKITKAAKRYLKKKGGKSESSGGSDDTGSSSTGVCLEDENVFSKTSKVKLLAERYPGCLAAQTLSQMRTVLLTEIGSSDSPGLLKDVAVAYFKQELQRRTNGPSQRELLTLSCAVDALVKGQPSKCLDLLLQRFKSIESTLNGHHWTVSQRMELAPLGGQSLATSPELEGARKSASTEAKLKYEASQPEGRAGRGAKEGNKNQQVPDKGDWRRNQDQNRKGGKGAQNKGDGGKKNFQKDDGGNKA